MDLDTFFEWLNGVVPQHLVSPPPKGLSVRIQSNLNSVFQHVIDPEVDGNNPVLKELLQSVHDGPRNRPTFC